MTDELKDAQDQLAKAKKGGDGEEIADAQARVDMLENAAKPVKPARKKVG